MSRAGAFALVYALSIAGVACSKPTEQTPTSETRTTSAEQIPTVDLRSLTTAPVTEAGAPMSIADAGMSVDESLIEMEPGRIIERPVRP